jgi:hypothetical protein
MFLTSTATTIQQEIQNQIEVSIPLKNNETIIEKLKIWRSTIRKIIR